jgi:hypothetical protein
MSRTANRRNQVNPLHLAPLARWLLLAVVVGACGLLFVYVKNQQHAIGEQTRQVEREIREARSHNEVLLARISALSSRAELQRKIGRHVIALRPIQDHRIARLIPPATAIEDGILRTVANGGVGP